MCVCVLYVSMHVCHVSNVGLCIMANVCTIMGPECAVQRSSESISWGKLLPAVHNNISWFQGKQLEV